MSDLYYRFQNGMYLDEKAKTLKERAKILGDAAEQMKCESTAAYAGLCASFAGCIDLLSRNLPFKAGDRVRLVKAPACTGGWESSKHFLVVGALATVKGISLDYLMRDWSVYLEFDDESWIPSGDSGSWHKGPPYKAGDKVLAAPDQRHVYGFGPSFIKLDNGSTVEEWWK